MEKLKGYFPSRDISHVDAEGRGGVPPWIIGIRQKILRAFPTGALPRHRFKTFSADCKVIVTASDDETARLWDAETGKPVGKPLQGHTASVNSATFSPDGKRITIYDRDGGEQC